MTSEAEPGAAEPVAAEAIEAASRPGDGLDAASTTGDERVDAALAGLGGLAGVPVSAHVAVFTEVQQGLQSVLAALDAENDGEALGESGRP
jgi:hypothetical protein